MSYLKLAIVAVIAIAILGLAATAFWYRGAAIAAKAETAQARADLKTANDVNAADQATIGRLRAQADADGKLTAELASHIAAANQKFIDDQAERNRIGTENEDAGKFLHLAIPPALRWVPVKPKAAGAGQD